MSAPRPPRAAPPLETLDDSIDQTAPPQRSPLRGVLPFGPKVEWPQPSAGRPPQRGFPRSSPGGEETAPAQRSPLAAALPFKRPKMGEATVAFEMPSAEDLQRLGRSALPSAPAAGKAGSGEPPVLTIEQYAALCAEVAVFAQEAEAVFARYGLGGQKHRMSADLAWQSRLRADAALMQKWQSLYLYYHEHYSCNPRG